jgi:hypothetical protein
MLKSLSYSPEHVTPELKGCAWLGHIPFAYWLTAKLKPRIFVELGTHGGGSYFAFCDSVVDNALTTKCFAVDSWEGDEQAGFYGSSVFDFVCSINQQKYSDFSSLCKSTFDNALDSFEDGSVDLLHIDGFHSFEAVAHDFTTWESKLSDNAIVLFHDTQVFKDGFGVHEYWSTLLEKHKSACFEFYHSHGLGVLCMNPRVDFQNEFIPDGISPNEFRILFEMAGKRVASQARNSNGKKLVSPDEVLHLVKVLSLKSEPHRKAIASIVA